MRYITVFCRQIPRTRNDRQTALRASGDRNRCLRLFHCNLIITYLQSNCNRHFLSGYVRIVNYRHSYFREPYHRFQHINLGFCRKKMSRFVAQTRLMIGGSEDGYLFAHFSRRNKHQTPGRHSYWCGILPAAINSGGDMIRLFYISRIIHWIPNFTLRVHIKTVDTHGRTTPYFSVQIDNGICPDFTYQRS